MVKTTLHLATVVVLTFLMNPAHAQKKWPHMPTPDEIAMMPDYCQAKMGSNPDFYQQWNKRMGPDKFMHLHHYCHGLKMMNRFKLTFEKQQRRGALQEAIGEFNYVLRAWPDGFYLKTEAQTKKTQAEHLLLLL